jgi:hypothetical protein
MVQASTKCVAFAIGPAKLRGWNFGPGGVGLRPYRSLVADLTPAIGINVIEHDQYCKRFQVELVLIFEDSICAGSGKLRTNQNTGAEVDFLWIGERHDWEWQADASNAYTQKVSSSIAKYKICRCDQRSVAIARLFNLRLFTKSKSFRNKLAFGIKKNFY